MKIKPAAYCKKKYLMDPSLYIVMGLCGIGYYLNRDGKTPRNPELQYQNQYVNVPQPQNTNTKVMPQRNAASTDIYNNYDISMQVDKPDPHNGNPAAGMVTPFSLPPDEKTGDYFKQPMPHFGSKITQQVDPDRGKERLDLFVGHRPTDIPKMEQKPLFEPTPQAGVQNYNETMTSLDSAGDRYLPSQKYDFVTPIEKLRVGPGLNLAPNEVSRSTGFQENVRIMPNNVDAYKMHQLEGRVHAGKALNENRTSQFEEVTKNTPFRYYTVSDESFLPTKASVHRETIRSEYVEGTSELRGMPKGNNELQIGGAVAYHHGSGASTRIQNDLKETNRGQECDRTVGVGGVASGQGHTIYSGPSSYQTVREETQLNDHMGFVGGVNKGNEQNTDYTRNVTQREGIGERNFEESVLNVRGAVQGNPITTSYRNEPTNREQTVNSGAPHKANGHNTSLETTQVKTTGKEASHVERTGNINGTGAYKPGMSYAELMNMEGFSLRASTDENRAPGPQRMNNMKDASEIHNDVHLREELNTAREGGVEPRNTTYKPIERPELGPNRLETPDERLDPSLVQAQLQNNPYRKENKSGGGEEPRFAISGMPAEGFDGFSY